MDQVEVVGGRRAGQQVVPQGPDVVQPERRDRPGVEVGGQHRAGGAHELGEPARDRAAARADLPCAPAGNDTDRREGRGGQWVVIPLDERDALALLPTLAVVPTREDVGRGHAGGRSTSLESSSSTIGAASP